KSWEWEKIITETATARGLVRGMKQGMKQGMEQGMKQGMEQGMKQGMEQGMKQGMEQGIKQGMEQGIEQATVKIILNMYKNNSPLEQIALATEKTIEEIKAVIEQNDAVLV
ncbi:MAG: hypothetical protein NC307_11960, partial [Roseburia sp.]|nr:hypothetical protein [Roseburia sp.]